VDRRTQHHSPEVVPLGSGCALLSKHFPCHRRPCCAVPHAADEPAESLL